jgi:hypothetical protein
VLVFAAIIELASGRALVKTLRKNGGVQSVSRVNMIV